MLYTLIVVTSLDGKIARHSFHFTDWASEEDQTHFKSYLNNSEAIVAGNNTFKTANEQLSKRNCIVLSKSVDKIEKINENLVFINPENADVNHYLQEEGYQKITVLGGGQTYSWALQNQIKIEILLTLEPMIFGHGISFFDTVNSLNKKCKLLSAKQLNDRGTLLLHYKVIE